MLNMINIAQEEKNILNTLGNRLKEARLRRNESQEIFAQRLGLSRQSYSKMEKGIPTVPLGYWLKASNTLGRLNTWKEVLQEKQNLFNQFEQQQPLRKRAGKKEKNK
ncbi:MAG: helix-turn-helix transcriptional regulator [Thermodesulfobacteriota bacterium]|nr:helix-turn-helix transcriptional regulator [Thermodesulfobacteriota bacterium]